MTWFDYIVIGVTVLSIAIGWWRGMSYEVLSLVGWVAAYLVARSFEKQAVSWVPAAITADWARSALAYAGLFIVTLFICAVLGWFLSKLIKFSGLGILDGLLGAGFGLLRGVFIVLVLVWLGGMTDIPKKPFWREALLSAPLQKLALFAIDVLPDDVAKKISY
jgi:membrane protein required for colicin V production